jgi:hypothetical protein
VSGSPSRGFFVWVTVIGLLLLLLVAAISGGLFERNPQRNPIVLSEPSSQENKRQLATAPKLSQALGIDESELVEVGGIKRPKRDIAFANSARQQGVDGDHPAVEGESKPDEFTKSLLAHPGQVPLVPADANEQVSQLYQELKSENPPLAARSAMFEAEQFDRAAYEADPAAYLKRIRPGRVFEPAQPGADVKRIETRSPMFHHVLQGEKVVFEVAADPGMPVTFYTPQVGEFENRLTTYSVAANTEGIARAVYLVGSGSMGIVDVLAASPVHSGQLQFKVRVSLAE